MTEFTPTYCTPEDVAETLDLPEFQDNYGNMTFSDMSHPSYDQVCRMICANEDIIDRRVRRTWRENRVIRQQLTIQDYWGDINGWRSDYYQRGGHYIQLRKDVRQWDTTPVVDEERTETITVPSIDTMEVDDVIMVGNKFWQIVELPEEPLESGKYELTVHPVKYPGDKLEIRSRNNVWLDLSDSISDMNEATTTLNAGPSNDSTMCFIDYPYGKIYLRTRLYQQKANAVRVTYRYGIVDDVPAAINRLACLLTAIQVINMQPFFIKVGASGDLGNVRNTMIEVWTNEINSIYTSYQRSGSVHTMW